MTENQKFGHMDPALKARWINALLSGDYKQGQGLLRDARNGHCCLGVLCDVLKDEVGGTWEQMNDGSYKFVLPEDGREDQPFVTAGLPEVIVSMTGVSSLGDFAVEAEASEVLDFQYIKAGGDDDDRYGYSSLSSMNDDGEPFEVIAKVIDRHF